MSHLLASPSMLSVPCVLVSSDVTDIADVALVPRLLETAAVAAARW